MKLTMLLPHLLGLKITFMVVRHIVGSNILHLRIMSSCRNHLLHRQLHHGLHTLQHIVLDRRHHHHQYSQAAVEDLPPIIRDPTILFHRHLPQAML